MKRLLIYFHYDAQGSLDEPCRFAVQALRPFGDLLVVTNGTLGTQDQDWLHRQDVRLLQRQNTGLDVGAYREALLTLGRETVCEYEELVLMNFTLAGPVGDLAPMFAAMESREDLDFWGLTRHYAMRSRRFGGFVPEHLQSHFLAVRRRLLCQDGFWRYWQQMPLPRSYEESVARHETRFTAYFAEQGFTWDSYVDTRDLAGVFVNPIMACPRELVENRGCPFFKRRSFFTPYEDELRRTDGNAARDLYEYLKKRTSYPVDELLRALLRSQPLSALAKNMHWHVVLPEWENTSAQTPDLEALGLVLVRFAPVSCDPVTSWYLAQNARWADTHLDQAAELFAREPLLGVLCPALPLWPAADRELCRWWRQARAQVAAQVSVPLNDDPPAALSTGWVLVRKKAFPQGVPSVQDLGSSWLLPLQAQQNGFYTGTFAPAAQATAGLEQLQAYTRAAGQPAAVAKQLGRLLKHKIKR